jgi:hypothetical protein
MCYSRSSSFPSCSWVDYSFLDHFGSFFLPWFELWRELSLFTKGNQPIPHELADRAISWSRSQEPIFFCSSSISRDRLEIRCWCLEDIFSTLLRTYLQSFKSIRVVLIEFWPVLPRFVLLFLDSAEPPGKKHGTFRMRSLRGKTRNLRESLDRRASGENAEPPDLLLKICVWALRVLVLRSVFCFVILASQGSFSKYSCHQLAWILWVENSLSSCSVLVCGVQLCSYGTSTH